MPPHAPLTVGSEFAQRFRVVRVLGSGRLGSTYAVDPLPSGERRALKVMSLGPDLLKEARESYVADTARAARLHSLHLVQTFGAGIDDATGQAWLASELMPGQSLATRIHLWGRLPLADVRQLVGALGEALGAAHAGGLSHHAFTPQKVHLLQDPARTIKLRDLGASRLIARALAAGDAPGAPAIWAALEQLVDAGSPATPAANVWSLGLLAFHALTGRSYWVHGAADAPPKEVLSEILSEPLVPPSQRAAALGCEEGIVPIWFDAWFARCVARDPEERWKDAKEAKADWALRDDVADDDARLTIPLIASEDEGRPTVPLAPKPGTTTSPTPPPTTAVREPASEAPTPKAPTSTGYGRLVAFVAVAALAAVWATNAWRALPVASPPGGAAATTASAEAPLLSAATPAPALAANAEAGSATAGMGATSESGVLADVSDGGSAYALDEALKALNKVYYGDCTVPAAGKLLVQFAPTGRVKQVTVQEGDYDEETASCLVARFRLATVPPFQGKPHYVTATVVATR